MGRGSGIPTVRARSLEASRVTVTDQFLSPPCHLSASVQFSPGAAASDARNFPLAPEMFAKPDANPERRQGRPSSMLQC